MKQITDVLKTSEIQESVINNILHTTKHCNIVFITEITEFKKSP